MHFGGGAGGAIHHPGTVTKEEVAHDEPTIQADASRGSSRAARRATEAELRQHLATSASASMRFVASILQQAEDVPAAERKKRQVIEKGVKQSIYLDYINRELTNESVCLELPVTFALLLCFSILALELLRLDKVYAVQEAIKVDMLTSRVVWLSMPMMYEDAAAIADVWTWLRLGFLPFVVQPTWAYSEDSPTTFLSTDTSAGPISGSLGVPDNWLFDGYGRPAPVQNDYLRYNRIIGGVRLRQTIAEASRDLCILPAGIDKDLLESWLGKPCMPSSDGERAPEPTDSKEIAGLTREEWLFTEFQPLEELQRALIDMEDGCSHAAAVGDLDSCRCITCREKTPRQPYIDEQTRRLEVAFVLYNPIYGLYLYVGINFFFNRGGQIYKHVEIMSAWSNLFGRPAAEFIPLVIAGSIWVLINVKLFVSEIQQMVQTVRSSKDRCWRAIRDDYVGFWNLVDWISFGVGFAVVGQLLTSWLLTDSVNDGLAQMMDSSSRARAGSIQYEEYKTHTEAFYNIIDDMFVAEQRLHSTLFYYPTIMLLRLVKSFEAQPRLAVVTKTLGRACQDLIHFTLVFVGVWMCFVILSLIFFGQDVEDFCSLPRAIGAGFLALNGDWDFEAMQEIGFEKAAIWFWCFALLVVLVLFSMLSAVLLDAYAVEKARMASSQSLATQTYEMYRRFRQYRRGERVRLNDIWNAFEKEYDGDVKTMLADERPITPDWLCMQVPNLKQEQARRTLGNSMARHQDDIEAEYNDETWLQSIRDAVRQCERRLNSMLREVGFLASRARFYDKLRPLGDPEFNHHFGQEDMSSVVASHEILHGVMATASQDFAALFVDGLRGVEAWQDGFERQQDELQVIVSEMWIRVRQQARRLAAMAEAVELADWTDEEDNADYDSWDLTPRSDAPEDTLSGEPEDAAE